MRLAERAAEDGEILREDVHQAAVDAPGAGHHPVPRHDLLIEPEVGRAVGDEAIELDEAALVEQQIEPLPRGQLALLVLLGHPRRPASLLGERLAVVELVEELAGVGHGRR